MKTNFKTSNNIISLKKLRKFYNFEDESDEHIIYTLSELKMLLFLTNYRDEYSTQSFKYSELLSTVYDNKIDKIIFKKILNAFGFTKNPTTKLYEIKLDSDWRVDMTSEKHSRKYREYNSLENKKNVNRYATMPAEMTILLFASKDINFWKLSLYILYKSFSDPNPNFSYDFDVILEKLNVSNLRQNKVHNRIKFIEYLKIMEKVGFIYANIINDDDELKWFKTEKSNGKKAKNKQVFHYYISGI